MRSNIHLNWTDEKSLHAGIATNWSISCFKQVGHHWLKHYNSPKKCPSVPPVLKWHWWACVTWPSGSGNEAYNIFFFRRSYTTRTCIHTHTHTHTHAHTHTHHTHVYAEKELIRLNVDIATKSLILAWNISLYWLLNFFPYFFKHCTDQTNRSGPMFFGTA